jgi:hypothetical protein
MATLEAMLAQSTNENVRDKASEYAAIMRTAGFDDVQSLLGFDDGELNEMHQELKLAGVNTGHSMEIRKLIKSRRAAAGGGGPANTPTTSSAIDLAVPDITDAKPVNSSRALPAQTGPENVYIAHVHSRINELASILANNPQATATVPSDDGSTPCLGKGLALSQWKVRPRWASAVPQLDFTDGQYQSFIAALDAALYRLRDMFPGRVVFGRVGSEAAEPPSSSHYHVWGANASNWSLPTGQQIMGGGMAAKMGIQREGVFGIVRPREWRLFGMSPRRCVPYPFAPPTLTAHR